MNPAPYPANGRTNPNLKDATVAERWLMFRKFLRYGTSVASVSPSSKHMVRSLISDIDFDNAKCLVELGAGTGPVTVELLRRVKPHTKLIIVEIDKDFCNNLRKRFPGADIVEGSAAELDSLLAARGIGQVDHVISGLPVPSFDPGLRQSILSSASRCLAPNGTFRQLTIIPYLYWKLYRGYFQDVSFRLVPMNLPPGGVYVCRGYRGEDKTRP